MITCVDLFCGLGGLTHGLLKGGVNVAAGFDLDEACRFPYEANNPGARFVRKDVGPLSGDEVRSFWPDGSLSLLAGCAPCQPFSTYSQKARKSASPRAKGDWELVEAFGRLIGESRPDLVTMENVPQLLDHEVFEKFVDALDEYRVWKGVVECARYGVPQTRKRLVLLASRLGPISLDPPTGAGNATVRAAISRLPSLKAGEAHPQDRLHVACGLSELNLRRIQASKPGGTWRDWPAELVARCHRKGSGASYPSVYGRMEWDAPAPTITTQSHAYGSGRFGHPEQDRAISLREAAILQTFPPSYQFLPDDAPVRFASLGRLIGNAVPVRLGEVVAKTLVRHVLEHRGNP